MDLHAALDAARAHALAAKALLPIVVEGETVRDGGVDFRVEWISSLSLKDFATLIPQVGQRNKGANPFLPYEQDLHVADLSDTHVAILNKFPSFKGHFLIITKAFVEQETPLDRADIEATTAALSACDAFGFYNSGGTAGASQPHRHLQLIPDFPVHIAPLLPTDGPVGKPVEVEALPFRHRFVRMDRAAFETGVPTAMVADAITEGCAAAGLAAKDGVMPPYNLLFTRDWLIVVPRIADPVQGFSLSALSYSGLIGLRAPDQLAPAREHGPMRLLIEAAGPRT
jgi:ATP adenylyltransferase